MGPVSLVVGCQQELDFSPLLFGCCGREARYGPADREPFFSGVVDLFKSVDDYMKGCYMWTT
jgi:hypothetical protein